jgi:hypothetical protein
MAVPSSHRVEDIQAGIRGAVAADRETIHTTHEHMLVTSNASQSSKCH